MKAIVLYFFSIQGSGGAERRICQLSGELSNIGYKVYLCSLDIPSARSYYPLAKEITWWRLGSKKKGLSGKLSRIAKLYLKLKRNKIEVFVGFVMSSDKSIYAATKLARVRLVVAERNSPSMYWIRLSKFQRKLVFLCMRFADKITVQNSDFISQYPKVLHNRILTIPNPVLFVENKPLNVLTNKNFRYKIIVVSRLDNLQKRIDVLINSFALIADEFLNWDLQIIGDGPDKKMLADQIVDLCMANRIELTGNVRNVYEYYESAHLFVIPSLWEGFPNALAEAMSYSLPVIGFSDASGVAELIREGGWLVKHKGGVEDLSECLRDAISNPDERRRRGNLAKKLIEPFTPEKHLSSWDSLIENLL